jgi:Tfp pilus assembly protein PilN
VAERINLIPQNDRPQGKITYDIGLGVLGALLVSYMAFTFFNIHHIETAQTETLEHLEHELSITNQTLSTIKTANKNSGVAEGQVAPVIIEDVIRNKTAWADPMKEISLLIPDDVWISKLTAGYDKLGGRTLTLIGSAASEEKVSEFFSVLEKSYYFRNVVINLSERQKDVAPLLYNYEFAIPLKKDGRVVANETR